MATTRLAIPASSLMPEVTLPSSGSDALVPADAAAILAQFLDLLDRTAAGVAEATVARWDERTRLVLAAAMPGLLRRGRVLRVWVVFASTGPGRRDHWAYFPGLTLRSARTAPALLPNPVKLLTDH